MTASSAGTSTPSDKQRALDKILHSLEPDLSHAIKSSRFLAEKLPSTCLTSQRNSTSESLGKFSMTGAKSCVNSFEAAIVRVKATAVFIGAGSNFMNS